MEWAGAPSFVGVVKLEGVQLNSTSNELDGSKYFC